MSSGIFSKMARYLIARTLLVCGLLGLSYGVMGCAASIEDRIIERQEAFDMYPTEVQERLRRGQIRLGDDQDAVWMVYGEPSETMRRVSTSGTAEVWIYKILSYNTRLTHSVRPVYQDVGGRLRGSYYIDDTPEYEWKEVLRIEFTQGHVSAVQMYD